MAKYETRQNRGDDKGGWHKLTPVDSIQQVLDEYPDAVVQVGGHEWRRAPRSKRLIGDIANVIWDYNNRREPSDKTADAIYELLEEKGLV